MDQSETRVRGIPIRPVNEPMECLTRRYKCRLCSWFSSYSNFATGHSGGGAVIHFGCTRHVCVALRQLFPDCRVPSCGWISSLFLFLVNKLTDFTVASKAQKNLYLSSCCFYNFCDTVPLTNNLFRYLFAVSRVIN